MSKINGFMEWFKMSYPTRNVESLRRRASSLTIRLSDYAQNNYGTHSADRMESVVKTSWNVLTGMNLIPEKDKVFHLKGLIKILKMNTKMNGC
jgi:hypothetical protein